jgi:hypothetical protein
MPEYIHAILSTSAFSALTSAFFAVKKFTTTQTTLSAERAAYISEAVKLLEPSERERI